MLRPKRPTSSILSWPALLLVTLTAVFVPSALGAEEFGDILDPFEPRESVAPDNFVMDEPDPITEQHLRWLVEVQPLLTRREYDFFRTLERSYQREAFIEAFWRVRDPFPRTARNELKERWPYRVAEAKSKWGSLDDDRSRIFTVHGPPSGSYEVKCTRSRAPAEVWAYRGTDLVDVNTVLIFITPRFGDGRAILWRPGYSEYAAEQLARRASACINGAQMMRLMQTIRSSVTEYEPVIQRLLAKPRPQSEEWLDSFQAFSTEMPTEAMAIAGDVEFTFPGRHQHRSILQGLLTVARDDVTLGDFAGHLSYDFQLNGEVLQGGELFESFRYKFGFPGEGMPQKVPISFQRFLRPGEYQLILRLDDLNSERIFRVEKDVVVPRVDQVVDVPMFKDPETAKLFEEATAALSSGETGLRLIPPRGELQTGFTRFDALVSGDEISKVRFVLDGKTILTKNRPPFQVSIDLGPYPDLRELIAVGVDAAGEVVAEDELLVNSGGYRFAVNLIEPRKGKEYRNSLQARAEVDVPEGRSLERLEIFLNETPVATLYPEPFVQPVVLPPDESVGYVRAVAYLTDGNTTEDLVFINAPGEVEELDVQFVELYTSVLDGQGRPVLGLDRNEIRVIEDGVAQDIRRFEQVRDLPIHVGILLDTSASMGGVLDDVRRAALTFINQAITPRDRASVITFNSFPELKVSLTSDPAALGAGLAGLSAEGRTALYDSVMFSLYYFTGIKGQRSILILSDGKDESSRFDFDQTLEYARRAGITLYTIGLRLGSGGARIKLNRLAEETGGSSYFIRDIDELEAIYTKIQEELRSQLLIAYQSSNAADDGEFRRVEVEVERPGARARTISGYYP
ncbi:MAG: VWA domain-containing protein [Acidobacteriota bacterium]